MSESDPVRGTRERRGAPELTAGLTLSATGFLAVLVAWFRATGAAGPEQVQLLIVGGCGGLALVVAGSTLVQTHVTARAARLTADKLDRVADALRDMAAGVVGEQTAAVWAATPDDTVVLRPAVGVDVILSKSAYHRPECRLVRGHAGLSRAPLEDAQARGLRPCGVCQAGTSAR